MLAEKRNMPSPQRRVAAKTEQPRPALSRHTSPMTPRATTCACGGACPHCQAKSRLTIGAPDDAYEREADAVAEQVMRMADERAGPGASAVPRLQRRSPVCDDGTTPVAQNQPGPASVQNTLNTSGQPLSRETRSFFEPRFGHDFSTVRVHTDAAAERSARELSALAYTVGQDIVFARGQFAPATSEGRRLLAHELTHVVQQAAVPGADHVSPVGRAAHDGNAQGTGLASSRPQPVDLAVMPSSSARLQRYVYNQNCSADARSIIAGGYKLADWATKRAKSMLEAGAPSDGLAAWFDFLFGDQAAAKRGQIAANFKALNDAMHEDYAFICPPAGTKPCIGAQAEVDDDRNVHVCLDKISAFSQAGVARLLVHENVRRAHGRRNVTNINDATGECVGAAGSKRYAEATTDANHPIPYSCFAEKLITIYLAEQEKLVDALFQNLYGSGLLPTNWHGRIIINGKAAPIDVSLRVRLMDSDFFVFGDYSYRDSEGRLVAGTIPYGLMRFIGPAGRSEALRIEFEWEEGAARGQGRWLSSSETTLDGTWGRGDSASNGGAWTITASRPETK